MTGTVVTHKTQVGQSSTAANNFTIRTLDDGSLRISRGNAGAETSDVLVIDANGNFSTAPVLGVGQSWQDVLASRVSGTTYTNTTGRPIMVSVTKAQSSASNNYITVDGVIVGRVRGYGIEDQAPLVAIVPNGSQYSVTTTSAIQHWAELR